MLRYIRHFKVLEYIYIRNCVVTIDDAKIIVQFFGREPVSIKWKSARRTPKDIEVMTLVDILDTVIDLHPTLDLVIDYVYVQGIPMLHIISKKYEFRTIEAETKQIQIRGLT